MNSKSEEEESVEVVPALQLPLDIWSYILQKFSSPPDLRAYQQTCRTFHQITKSHPALTSYFDALTLYDKEPLSDYARSSSDEIGPAHLERSLREVEDSWDALRVKDIGPTSVDPICQTEWDIVFLGEYMFICVNGAGDEMGGQNRTVVGDIAADEYALSKMNLRTGIETRFALNARFGMGARSDQNWSHVSLLASPDSDGDMLVLIRHDYTDAYMQLPNVSEPTILSRIVFLTPDLDPHPKRWTSREGARTPLLLEHYYGRQRRSKQPSSSSTAFFHGPRGLVMAYPRLAISGDYIATFFTRQAEDALPSSFVLVNWVNGVYTHANTDDDELDDYVDFAFLSGNSVLFYSDSQTRPGDTALFDIWTFDETPDSMRKRVTLKVTLPDSQLYFATYFLTNRSYAPSAVRGVHRGQWGSHVVVEIGHQMRRDAELVVLGARLKSVGHQTPTELLVVPRSALIRYLREDTNRSGISILSNPIVDNLIIPWDEWAPDAGLHRLLVDSTPIIIDHRILLVNRRERICGLFDCGRFADARHQDRSSDVGSRTPAGTSSEIPQSSSATENAVSQQYAPSVPKKISLSAQSVGGHMLLFTPPLLSSLAADLTCELHAVRFHSQLNALVAIYHASPDFENIHLAYRMLIPDILTDGTDDFSGSS